MSSLDTLRVRIFADGADLDSMLELSRRPHIKGLTTNPTLMRKAGIRDYRAFAREVLSVIRDKPVCFEVLADDFESIERQADEIAAWADNVYVKIPVTNTRGESSAALIGRLSARRVKINVTAITTLAQIRSVLPALNPAIPSFVSVFAGRIADTGIDPVPVMARAVQLLSENPGAQLIWASSRELLNIFQADSVGCAVITVTRDILDKLTLIGYDLTEFSLDTVKMFRDDAQLAGYSL
ncbi:MAG TPA: transaldolase [Steroidobacteraceae bacterium]|jgi:transaldolase